jgi:hypothetical protein
MNIYATHLFTVIRNLERMASQGGKLFPTIYQRGKAAIGKRARKSGAVERYPKEIAHSVW